VSQIAPDCGAALVVGIEHGIVIKLFFHARQAIHAGDVAVAVVGDGPIDTSHDDHAPDVDRLHQIQKSFGIDLFVLVWLLSNVERKAFPLHIRIVQVVFMGRHALPVPIDELDRWAQQMMGAGDLE